MVCLGLSKLCAIFAAEAEKDASQEVCVQWGGAHIRQRERKQRRTLHADLHLATGSTFGWHRASTEDALGGIKLAVSASLAQ